MSSPFQRISPFVGNKSVASIFIRVGQSAEGPVLRILTEKPPAGAVSAVPGLEDAFLAIYREEQP